MPRQRARARAGCASSRPSRNRSGGAEGDRELVGPRQLLEMAESELLEEDRRRAVQKWAANAFGATGDLDQAAVMERLEHTANRDAPDLLDLCAPDRLPIGDECQRLECGGRESMGPCRELRALDRFGVLGAGEDLPATTDLDQLDPVAVVVVVLPQLGDRGRDV